MQVVVVRLSVVGISHRRTSVVQIEPREGEGERALRPRLFRRLARASNSCDHLSKATLFGLFYTVCRRTDRAQKEGQDWSGPAQSISTCNLSMSDSILPRDVPRTA